MKLTALLILAAIVLIGDSALSIGLSAACVIAAVVYGKASHSI